MLARYSNRFGSPPHLLLSSMCPKIAALLEVLPLLQLLLPELGAHHHVAVLVDAISEVLAGHTFRSAFPVPQVAVVDEIQLLHR